MSIILSAKKMKCPICGSKLNCGSVRPANIYAGHPTLEEKITLSIFYCQVDDRHNFGVISRRNFTEITKKRRTESD